LNAAEALRWARKDLEVRHSIYAYDSLAWALYRNGDFTQAADAITNALALQTKDAHLLYHAAMIYSSVGDLDRAKKTLKDSLAINPHYNSFHAHR
jgi:tetratricopeptide (TPR) repeat protein